MAKCNPKTHPKLFAYLEAYGLDTRIIGLIDRIKENYHYCLVGWKNSSGLIEMLDLSQSPDHGGRDYRDGSSMAPYGYNMLNDGMEPITEEDWERVKLDKHCDTFIIPGHEEYGR